MDGQPPTNSDLYDKAEEAVKRFAWSARRRSSWILLDDLKQAGWVGYTIGRSTYDPTRGASELTWVKTKIESAISDFVRKERRARRIDQVVSTEWEHRGQSEGVRTESSPAAATRKLANAMMLSWLVSDDVASTPEAICGDEETRELLAANLSLLTPREREVIRWALQGFTEQEIAALLGVNKSTVNRQMQSASERLRKTLNPGDEGPIGHGP
jgi:RNA polymerase sigma factor (sigma-70 family)